MTTPPPQGQAPYPPQGQAPYPPQGQAPYPPQPGYPQQATAPYAPVPAPAPKRGIRQYLRIGGIILGLVVVAGGWYFNNSDDTKKLAVGDCLTNKGSDNSPEIEQLDCSNSKADYKVLKKDGSTSLSQLACQSTKGTTAAIEWKEGSDSFVLCLGDNK
ncbi:hypothetical protein [Streptomyces sp. NPDC001843]|uniref:LppU/SCO3897 family protein n=1 Tax=Streptomyces sp. NPDC001843 TaxID=3364617 RepID=UPI0036A575D2